MTMVVTWRRYTKGQKRAYIERERLRRMSPMDRAIERVMKAYDVPGKWLI